MSRRAARPLRSKAAERGWKAGAAGLRVILAWGAFLLVFSLVARAMAGAPPPAAAGQGEGAPFAPMASKPAAASRGQGTMLPLGQPERIFAAPRYAAGIGALSGKPAIRSEQWRALVRLLRALPMAARPGIVLAWLKGRAYRSDPELWHEPDHWDDIDGFLTHGGDCEEFAIAAYRLLRESGVPDRDLRIVLARAPADGRDHAYVVVEVAGRRMTLDPLSDRNAFASTSAYLEIVAFNAERVWLLAARPAAGSPPRRAGDDR